jgi:hypothetical protein
MTNEELLREGVAKLKMQMAYLSEKLDDTHRKVEEMDAYTARYRPPHASPSRHSTRFRHAHAIEYRQVLIQIPPVPRARPPCRP